MRICAVEPAWAEMDVLGWAKAPSGLLPYQWTAENMPCAKTMLSKSTNTFKLATGACIDCAEDPGNDRCNSTVWPTMQCNVSKWVRLWATAVTWTRNAFTFRATGKGWENDERFLRELWATPSAQDGITKKSLECQPVQQGTSNSTHKRRPAGKEYMALDEVDVASCDAKLQAWLSRS